MNYTKGVPLKMFLMLAHRDELKEAIKRMNEDNSKMLEALKDVLEDSFGYEPISMATSTKIESLINDIEK